jgi:hypothetical protein
MKELKFKTLYSVNAYNQSGLLIQWACFKYKKEAEIFAQKIGGAIIGKKKVLTDKY